MKKLFLAALTVLAGFTGIWAGEPSALRAKPIVNILGDSYSTFEDYIPAGNESWYFRKAPDNRNDVTDVRQTWWWQMISEGGYILGRNESWSGAPIAYTGYRGEDYRMRSFVTRLPLVSGADLLIIFGGTNDSWIGTRLGDLESNDMKRMYDFKPALDVLLTEAVNRNPGTRIVYVINCDLREEITNAITEACRRHQIEYLQLRDIDKQSGHPHHHGAEYRYLRDGHALLRGRQ